MLARVAASRGCGVVVTGHTASDRAETLLFNMMRGSGTDGGWVPGSGGGWVPGSIKEQMAGGCLAKARMLSGCLGQSQSTGAWLIRGTDGGWVPGSFLKPMPALSALV